MENETPRAPSLSDVGTQETNPTGMPSLQDVENAMSGAETPTEPQTPTQPATDPAPTTGDTEGTPSIGQLSAAELSDLREQAEAFQALNEHPEILREAIDKMKAKFGQTPDPAQPESQQGVQPELLGRLDRMEQALSMLASRFVNNELAQREPQWDALKPQVEKLMAEIPGLTIEHALRVAKAEAGVPQGGQQSSAPTLQTTETHGAIPRVGENSSEEEFKSAVKKISALKSTSDAADFAIREAMRLNQKS